MMEATAPVIDISELSRRFETKTALDAVTLSIPRGAVYSLVGANGAGKTTLIKHILGLLRAQRGSRPFPNVPRWTANWARRNHCQTPPVDSSITPDVVRRTYTHCADGAPVVLYTVRGGGHTWPGGMELPEWFVGRTTRSIDATRLMWEFFAASRPGK